MAQTSQTGSHVEQEQDSFIKWVSHVNSKMTRTH